MNHRWFGLDIPKWWYSACFIHCQKSMKHAWKESSGLKPPPPRPDDSMFGEKSIWIKSDLFLRYRIEMIGGEKYIKTAYIHFYKFGGFRCFNRLGGFRTKKTVGQYPHSDTVIWETVSRDEALLNQRISL